MNCPLSLPSCPNCYGERGKQCLLLSDKYLVNSFSPNISVSSPECPGYDNETKRPKNARSILMEKPRASPQEFETVCLLKGAGWRNVSTAEFLMG